jgi:eukaryotic-like serine/threonine-protein kinase
MTPSPGTRLGPYEILSPLGAGGMGEVYRARDTRLGRDVAIKVLPQHLSANPEVRTRFEREAKTVSSLNHPSICTLFDVGREGDTDYLVMELVEGETLAARLAKGPLPASEVLKLGVQIADALDRAHRAGVVHRDLKPGNVMLTKSGAKLMDFGLARATGLAGPAGSGVSIGALTQSPTVAQPLTAEGTLIGTFQYMAPEQLEGKEADERSDLWALGCVLYEMATGKRAFEGKSQASLITSIMGTEPAPLSQVAPMTPPALDRVVQACLAKDPVDRIQSAHDVKLQLQWAVEGGSVAGAPSPAVARPTQRGSVVPWVVAVVSVLAAGAMFAQTRRGAREEAPSHAVHAAVLPPSGVVYSSSTDRPLPLAVSPDGKLVAYCARTGEGPDMLWVRSVDSNDARAIAGTEGTQGPFFSPDGKSIGFFARGKMKRVDTTGGAVITLAEGGDPRGATWSASGWIVFGSTAYGPLWKVREDGGAVAAATALDSTRAESTHRYPCFLPDGRHFLYLARRSGAGAGHEPTIFAGEFDSTKRTRVLEVASNVAYASGYLLYIREGVLVAQRFDLNTLAVSGSAIPLIDDARMDERFSRGVFSVSTNGVLVCMTGKNQTRTQLQWLDRSGKWLSDIGEPTDYTYGGTPELSPDGTQSAMPIANRERGTSDVWLVDLNSGRRHRLTVDAYDHPAAIWHPDGKRVVVSTNRGAEKLNTLDLLAVNGATLGSLPNRWVEYLWPRSVSPDGRVLLFDAPETTLRERFDTWAVSMTGDSSLASVAAGEGTQSRAQFSPDGRFFAYDSDESGQEQVYVAAYPGGGKWQVSQDGGSEPRWRQDGHELYYVDRDNFIVAVEAHAGGSAFEAGSATRLFQFHGAGGLWRYDANADGTRFLVTRALQEDLASPVTLITDWTRKVAGR